MVVDADPCGPDPCGTVGLPLGPFVSNRYHFGMLLGVADLETDQGYHRGKTWLHTAWLHGPGAVWGLAVEVRAESNEVVVLPGLANDGAGRELRVAERLCLDLGRWYAERRPADLDVTDDGSGGVLFSVHVTLSARQCLDRPVPAISEPCQGADRDTAYSRTVEQALPDLAPGPAPAEPVAPYLRLRQLAGQLPAQDTAVVAALAAIAAAPPADRGAVQLVWRRRLAALDTLDLAPSEGPGALFPVADGDGQGGGQGGGGAGIVLAEIACHLRPVGDRWVVVDDGAAPTTVDNTVRPAHVRSRTVQELLGAPTPAPDTAWEPPRAVARSASLADVELAVSFTRPLAAASVTPDAFAVTELTPAGWSPVTVTAATVDAAGTDVTLQLGSAPQEPTVRVVARGTGPTPLIGADGLPLSGVDVDGRRVVGGEDAALVIGAPQPLSDTPTS